MVPGPLPSSPNVPNVPSLGPSPLRSWDRGGSPLENSLLLGQLSACTLLTLSPPFEPGLWCMWCGILGRAPRSSPFAPHLDGRGLEKQCSGEAGRVGGKVPGKVTPSQASSLPQFNPVSPIPGSSTQSLQPLCSDSSSFLSLA